MKILEKIDAKRGSGEAKWSDENSSEQDEEQRAQ